jgi:C-terminal processing protease CtpA/Prc
MTVLLILNALACSANDEFTPEERAAVIEELSTTLRGYYVFPGVGEQYAEMLGRNLEQGSYDEFVDRKTFAERVTKDLKSLHEDRHLSLKDITTHQETMAKLKSSIDGEDADDASTSITRTEDMTEFSDLGTDSNNSHYGFKTVKWIQENVAYIELNLFPESPQAVSRAHEVMQSITDATVIIFDIRQHRGGGQQVIDAIVSYLFDEPTHMATMMTRNRGDDRIMEHVSQPNEMSGLFCEKPVYLLTSRKTGSAAEHFAAALKFTKRATLVGEPTAGAGHFGTNVPIDDHFVAFIPFGRTYDPATGKDWEAVGVQPDVRVEASLALETALNMSDAD